MSIKQADIFVREETEIVNKAADIVQIKTEMPNGYIEIKLDTLGKLEAPASLHFRNYSMEEALDLSSATEETFSIVLVKVLNKMVYEDFDCSNLHENEIEQIMMTLYANFYSTTLETHRYFLDETLTGDAKTNEKNLATASINIVSDIKTSTINDKYVEPFPISIDNKKIYFRLPKIKDVNLAKEFVDQKYMKEEREFSDVINAARIAKKQNKDIESMNIDVFRLKDYLEFLDKKAKDYMKVYMAIVICKVDDKEIITVEDKLLNFSKVDFKFWQAYNDVMNTKIKFGINPEVTFYSSELKKKVTRRFQFQLMDLIPPMELQKSSEYSVPF